MPSFISRFSQAIPRRALWLFGLASIVLALAAVYTLRFNPEVRFFRHAAQVKLAWAAELDRAHPRKVIVCGGSSAAFSVDGERMLREHGLPVVNAGLHAGMEPLFLCAFAAQLARSGDTLLVAIEPGLLMTPFSSPDLAAQMGLALGRPDLIHASKLTGQPIRWVEDLVSLRPGAYHSFTLLGKIALRKPLYRYSPEEITPSGWQRARELRDLPELGTTDGHLSPDSRNLLAKLKQWGDTNHIQVIYSLPWGYVHPARARALQRINLRFLREVAALVPVLKDPSLGAYPVREHFADTEWHLTAAGAAARSDSLAVQLKANLFWTQAELSDRERNL